jgi:translation initiation factor IF-1
LTLQKEENTQIDFSKELEGTITTMLPSTCFIDIDGNKQQLNQKFFKKVQGLKKGDKVKVTLWNNKITDIGK